MTQPPLLASTSLAAVEDLFPPSSPARARRELLGLGPELYLGFTLARLSCRDDFLARVTYGPGTLLTLALVRHRLPPGMACFELIGPLMYQVVALPLQQFPRHSRLGIVVRRPVGSAGNRLYLQLP